MASIEKHKFQILDVTESNYLTWYLDVKLHLRGLGFMTTLTPVDIDEAGEEDEANAMILIRYHLSEF